MLLSTGKVESVMREELHYFIPMFIMPDHGLRIQNSFEKICATMAGDSNFTLAERSEPR